MEDADRERELRAARNQSIFRAVNEQIQALHASFTAATEALTIACECHDTECIAMLAIAPSAYERVRSHPHRFAVLPGHVLPEVEEIVEEAAAYVVVEKIRAAAELAEALDPRAA